MTRFSDLFDLIDNKTTIFVYIGENLVGDFTKYYFPHILFEEIELCEVENIATFNDKLIVKVIEK